MSAHDIYLGPQKAHATPDQILEMAGVVLKHDPAKLSPEHRAARHAILRAADRITKAEMKRQRQAERRRLQLASVQPYPDACP